MGPENEGIYDAQSINRSAFRYYRRLRRVESYVEQNYSHPITLGDAARVACLERKYFSAFFRDKTGICFRDWLACLRVIRAAELMRQINHTITQVAGPHLAVEVARDGAAVLAEAPYNHALASRACAHKAASMSPPKTSGFSGSYRVSRRSSRFAGPAGLAGKARGPGGQRPRSPLQRSEYPVPGGGFQTTCPFA